MPLPLVPVIGAAATMGAAGMNMYQTGRMNKKNRAFAAHEAEKAYRRNIDMWNMQNAYNDPSKQMERIKNAGLNPHLMYGKGTVGNATQQPQYNAAEWKGEAPQLNVPNTVAMYNDVKRTKIQENVSKSAIELNNERANQISIEAAIKGLRLANQPQLEKYNLQAKKLLLDLNNQKLKNIARDYKIKGEKFEYDQWRWKYIKEKEFSPEGGFNIFKKALQGVQLVPSWLQKGRQWYDDRYAEKYYK